MKEATYSKGVWFYADRKADCWFFCGSRQGYTPIDFRVSRVNVIPPESEWGHRNGNYYKAMKEFSEKGCKTYKVVTAPYRGSSYYEQDLYMGYK